MESLIQLLQRKALDQEVSVSELLRMAKVVAVKLDLSDFLRWIEKELAGYGAEDKVPEYRIIRGEPKGYNPYHGWIPIIISDPESHNGISRRGVTQAIGELDNLTKKGNGQLVIPYSPEVRNIIAQNVGVNTDMKLFVGTSAVAGILDAVRNVILDWGLKLEKAGIKGEGMSFSQEDKNKAQEQHVTYQINSIGNFTGNMGPLNDQASLTIQQINAVDIKELKGLSEQIKKYLKDTGLDDSNQQLVKTQVGDLESELNKTDIEPTKIQKLLGSLKAIFEGVAGNVIAQGIIHEISKHIK